jgi:acid stress-induced BolA-like protein IbaG/YrbA
LVAAGGTVYCMMHDTLRDLEVHMYVLVAAGGTVYCMMHDTLRDLEVHAVQGCQLATTA